MEEQSEQNSIENFRKDEGSESREMKKFKKKRGRLGGSKPQSISIGENRMDSKMSSGF